MFNKKTIDERTGLDEAIDTVIAELMNHTPDTAEYDKVVTQLERLYKLKNPNKENTVSKDGLVAAIGNLLGIGMILGYEQFHVVSSKALGFVIKSRV